jgi:hypothetical protein
VVDHQRQQLLCPLLRRALDEAAAYRAERAGEVEQAPYLARVAPRCCGSLVDVAVSRASPTTACGRWLCGVMKVPKIRSCP